MKNLVIVESPSKSHTIEKYLGSGYKVVSSMGHIRDLATSGKYGLGVDTENMWIVQLHQQTAEQFLDQVMRVIRDTDQVGLVVIDSITRLLPGVLNNDVAQNYQHKLFWHDANTQKQLLYLRHTRVYFGQSSKNPPCKTYRV